jgi:hypothetical protein
MSRAVVRASAAVVALLLLVAALPSSLPAAAQQVGPPGTDPTEGPAVADVTLGAIDPVVPSGTQAGWTVVIEHTGASEWTRLEVVAELHGALTSRSALRAALAGGSAPPVLQRTSVVPELVRPLTRGSVVRVAGSVPFSGPALSGADTAVHPLRLVVLADGEPVGRIDTAVVRVGADPVATLATTLVWPLNAPPARDPSGDVAAVLDPLTLPGGRLDTLLTAVAPLAGPGAVPSLSRVAPGLALVVPAHLVEDLRERVAELPEQFTEDLGDGPPPAPPEGTDEVALRAADLLLRLRRTAGVLPAPPLVVPYADADVARLTASGAALQPLAARAVLEGGGRLLRLLGREAGTVTVLTGPVVPGVLDLVPDGIIIVPHATLEGPDLALDVPLGEPVRTLRSAAGRSITALVGDPFLSDALAASSREVPGDPVRAAHEILVRTAMVHLEAPGRDGRSLVLLPPEGFDPDPRFAAELLERIAVSPWLTPVQPAVVAGSTDPEPARLRDGSIEALPARLTGALIATARDLELLAGAIDLEVEPSADLVPVGGRALTDAGDELMRAASRAFSGDVEQALALLAATRAGVDAAFGTVVLAFDDVTLTDQDGTLPITLTHVGGVPIRVRLEVDGPSALTWTDGRVREVALGIDVGRTVEIPVRAGGSGRFPVSVRVTDPSGARVLAEDVIGVQATAFAGPALALIGALVLLLTVVGARRQRRRGLAWRTTEEDR